MDRTDRKLLGNKIFKMRQRKKLTQKQLAELAGLSESALRSYELGDRNPKPKHLEMIAVALEIRPEALTDFGILTNEQAIHALFRFEETGRLEPDTLGSKGCLVPQNRLMREFLRDWAKKKNELQGGKITEDEYEEWKDAYSPYVNVVS